jgi:multidrug/hemolysin transport system permease protein
MTARTAWAFAKRCLTDHMRDRSGVLFSLMAPGILLVLYAGFLSKMQIDSIQEAMPQVSTADARAATAAWVAASLLAITTLTAPVVTVSQLVSDKVSGRVDDFLVSPAPRRVLIGGAWLAAFIYALGVVLALGVICVVALVAMGATLPSLSGWLTLLAALALATAAFSAMSVLLGTMLGSEGAIGGVVGVLSSVGGFLAGVYVPVGVLGQGVASTVFALPFGQGAYLVRESLAAPAIESLGGNPQAVDVLREVYGFDLLIGGTVQPSWIAWAGVTLFGAVCAVWAMGRVRSLGRR